MSNLWGSLNEFTIRPHREGERQSRSARDYSIPTVLHRLSRRKDKARGPQNGEELGPAFGKMSGANTSSHPVRLHWCIRPSISRASLAAKLQTFTSEVERDPVHSTRYGRQRRCFKRSDSTSFVNCLKGDAKQTSVVAWCCKHVAT